MNSFTIQDKDTKRRLFVFDKDIAGNYLASINATGEMICITPSKLVEYYIFRGCSS